MKISFLLYSATLTLAVFSSCKKNLQNGAFENTGDFEDVSGSLKEIATFPIGMAIEYPLSSANTNYFNVVKSEVNSVTFGNELKNASLVGEDGSYNFTTADNFYNLASEAGLAVFGHTLVWHSQQRASYYNSLIGGGSGSSQAPNLIVNGSFEEAASNGDIAEGWQILNGSGQFSIAGGANVNSGTKSLQVDVPAGGQNYNTQIVNRTPIPVTAGKTYTMSYYIKGGSAQNVQFEIRNSDGTVNYQGGKPVTTSFAQVTYSYTVPDGVSTIQFAFDLGGTANIFFIDDVSITEDGYTPPSSNLVINPGFEEEASNGDIAEGWQLLNGSDQFSIAGGANVNSGAKSLQVNVPAGGQNYNTQIITREPIPVTAGKTYAISYYIKGASPQNIQIEVRPSGNSVNYYGGKPVTTSFSSVSQDYTVPDGTTTIQLAFDLGGTANTLFIDDVSIQDASEVAPPDNSELAPIVDAEMKKHIETVVGHYTGKIKAWDVLNEPLAENGELRNNNNTPAAGRNDVFVWQNYLGRDYAFKAFQYARAVDGNADLYMNEYNLESSAGKLDAFIALANDLKAANTGITGVGTQMHLSINSPKSGIINMMKRLAATGLKVRISEMDIKINPGGNNPSANFTPTATDLRYQAAMYKFVVATYLEYVPAAQRGGITFWGVDDLSSWLNPPANVADNKLEYPLLFDKDFNKKPAYAGVKQGIMEQGGEEN